ncbi:hypothetical protein ACLBW0_18475 [Enterobacteriaceae bacterium C34A]
MLNSLKMICVSSTRPEWFTVGSAYDCEQRGPDICICGDNLVSDLNPPDWYEISQRVDGLCFLIGYQQSVLFRPVLCPAPALRMIEVKVNVCA